MPGLYGMKAIRGFYPFSESTVLRDIRDKDFPAWKKDGIWISDTELIDDWRKGKVRAAPLEVNKKGKGWKK
jgi:hypothetical protein